MDNALQARDIRVCELCVRLPPASISPAMDRPFRVTELNNKTVHVLLVCSDPQRADQIEATLREAAACVFRAESARDAIQQGSDLDQRLDLVLTDFALPDSNGIAVLRHFRQFRDVPVAVFERAPGLEDAVAAFRAGAIDYLPDPTDSNDVRDLIQRISRVHAKQVELITSSEAGGGVNEAVSMAMPSDPSLVSVVTRRLSHWYAPACRHHRISTRPLDMALMEALTNAVVHGNLGVSSAAKLNDDWDGYQQQVNERMADPVLFSRLVRVRANLVGQCLSLVVRDEGDGFSPREIRSVDELGEDSTAGRGIAMIQKSMDFVSWNATGNEITMQKILSESPPA